MSRIPKIFGHLGCLTSLLVIGTGCQSPVVSDDALAFAQKRVEAELGAGKKAGSLVIVDYSKPSSKKRMTVVDLKTGRAKMNSLVAHGVNSGLLFATQFSDKPGSNQSSLGLYRVGEEYRGKHGRSLRLDGLDPGFNINARKRAIVIHAADYVSKETMKENRHEYGRLGRSAGCLSLSDKDMAKLMDKKMKRPAYVFAYAPTMVAQHEYPDPSPAQAPVPAPAPLPAPIAPGSVGPVLAQANVPTSPADSKPEQAAKRGLLERPAVRRPEAQAQQPGQYPQRTFIPIETGPVTLAGQQGTPRVIPITTTTVIR